MKFYKLSLLFLLSVILIGCSAVNTEEPSLDKSLGDNINIEALKVQLNNLEIPDKIVLSEPFDSDEDMIAAQKYLEIQESVLDELQDVYLQLESLGESTLEHGFEGTKELIEGEIKNMENAIEENKNIQKNWNAIELIFMVSGYLKQGKPSISLEQEIVDKYNTLNASEEEMFRAVYPTFSINRLRKE